MNHLQKIIFTLLLCVFNTTYPFAFDLGSSRKKQRTRSASFSSSLPSISEENEEEQKRDASQAQQVILDGISQNTRDWFASLTDDELIALIKARPKSHRRIISALTLLNEEGQEPRTPTRRASLSKLAVEKK